MGEAENHLMPKSTRSILLMVGMMVAISVGGVPAARALPATPTAVRSSAWDPNDVRGPLDLRWMGTVFTSTDGLRITVSFYDGFRVNALLGPPVRIICGFIPRVSVLSGSFFGGFGERPSGHLAFFWGRGDCPHHIAPVTRIGPNVLQVVIPATHRSYRLRARSQWHRQTDLTAWLTLGH